MTDLVLHEQTRREAAAWQAAPSHALLIVGQLGSGKTELAKNILENILQGRPESHPYYLHIEPATGKGSISIEAIRELQAFTKLKTTGSANWRRAVLVENAHTMTAEAQNAFLKLLEEPPADTLIVLTSSGLQGLLPTIVSRLQRLAIKTPTQSQLLDYFMGQGFTAPDIQKALHISAGQPGLMAQLLNGQQSDLTDYIDRAKTWLSQDSFGRLALADKFIRQKLDLGQLLWALRTVARAGLHQAASKDQTEAVKRWQRSLGAILQAEASLGANPQAKLLLSNLALHL